MSLAPILGIPDPEGADCVACGRCCHHPPRTVHLLESDDARLTEHELVHLTILEPPPPGFRFIVNDGERCGALDVSALGSFPCSIYARRPDDCRIVEPGSPCCLEARSLGRLWAGVEFVRRLYP